MKVGLRRYAPEARALDNGSTDDIQRIVVDNGSTDDIQRIVVAFRFSGTASFAADTVAWPASAMSVCPMKGL